MKIMRRVLMGVSALTLAGLLLWYSNLKKEEPIAKTEAQQEEPQQDDVEHGELQQAVQTLFKIVEAPEQTKAMEHEAFILEEYVSVIPAGTNVALEGVIEANDSNAQYTAKKANDAKTAGSSYWEGAPNSYPAILTLDVTKQVNVHAVKICLNPDSIWGDRSQSFSVWISTDGTEFTELVSEKGYQFSPTTGNEVVIEFDPMECQYVQLQFTSNTGATGAQVAEFEVYAE